MAGLAAVTNLRTQALDLHQPLHAVAAAGLARFAQVRKLPLIVDTREVELSGIFPPGGSMKKSKFSEIQIVAILKQGDSGMPIKDLCRQAGISTATYYQWKSKYGGMEASDLRRVKDLEAENAKLKRMYAELALDNAAMKELIAKKL